MIANPLLWFLSKSAERGAQTPLYLATDKGLGTETLNASIIDKEIKSINQSWFNFRNQSINRLAYPSNITQSFNLSYSLLYTNISS